MTTPIQQAAFEELSQGGGFFNHIEVRCQPMLTSDIFDTVGTNLPPVLSGSSYFYTTNDPPVVAFRQSFLPALAAAFEEFTNAWKCIIGRLESPLTDPLFALKVTDFPPGQAGIPGVSSNTTAASLIEHTDKYFGHQRNAPYAYYKSGLPPLLIKFASAKSVNDVMTALEQDSYPFPPNPTYPAGYFANTFPNLNIAPFLNASIPLLPDNTWYDEMVGTISGVIYPQIDEMNEYYSVTIPTNFPTFTSTINGLLNDIQTTIASIINVATFLLNQTDLEDYLDDIETLCNSVKTAFPPPVAAQQRIDAQIIQENARYYAHSFVMLNQGSVSTGFYQYRNDPNAYPILQICSTPTMLAALNEVIPTP